MRVRVAHREQEGLRAPRQEQWLLIEWPQDQTEPTKYWLSTLPADTALLDLVKTTKMRWRIERDYQELKQEFGLSHYEGRGGVAFIITPPCALPPMASCWQTGLNMAALKKTPLDQKCLAYPKITPRAAARRAQRHVPDSIATLRFRLACDIITQLPRCPPCNMVRQH